MFKVNGYTAPLYTCPMCHKTFESHADANECIAKHVVPIMITAFDDMDSDGPETLIVAMNNKTFARYEFVEVVNSEGIA